MSNPISLNFNQGETVLYPVVITEKDTGTPIDLTGAVITGDIRKEYNTEVLASFVITNINYQLVDGGFELTLSSAISEALPMNNKGRITSFVFDVDVKYPSGRIDTPISGYLKVTRRVTANV